MKRVQHEGWLRVQGSKARALPAGRISPLPFRNGLLHRSMLVASIQRYNSIHQSAADSQWAPRALVGACSRGRN